MAEPTLSAVMIAKNERENVGPCLISFCDHVDEIVFVDTGSRDGTIAEVRRVAREHGWSEKLVLGRFKWCADFAAARNYADSLATGDWVLSVDLDDSIIGAASLRGHTTAAPPDVMVIEMFNVYGSGPFGRTGPFGSEVTFWAQRLARRDAAPPWVSRLHEYRPVHGPWSRLVPAECRVVHRGNADEHIARNYSIASRWLREEPRNLMAIGHMASVAADLNRHEDAVDLSRRYLRRLASTKRNTKTACPDVTDAVRFTLSRSLHELGRYAEQRRHLTRWIADGPENVEFAMFPHVELAMLELAERRYAEVFAPASEAERLFSVSPDQHTHPHGDALRNTLREMIAFGSRVCGGD